MSEQANGCEGKGPHSTGERRQLGRPNAAGAILCRACWADEMKWRQAENKKLQPSDVQFPTYEWEELAEVK